jgi:FKBP-type peptidyl-prolyl cis-trans isomerase
MLSLALLVALAAPFARAEEPAPEAIPADGAAPVTTASGLVYSVLKAGPEGRKPKAGDVVIVHYTGYLQAGDKVKVFDSSRKRNQPLEMAVGGFIAGWNEALQLMTPGSRWKLTIPPALAYGKAGSPPEIPGDATLVFDMELIGVKRVPAFAFRAGTPAKQTSTAQGVKIEVVTAGEGRNATEDDIVEVAYALWSPTGKQIASSSPQGAHIKGTPGDVTLPFFKEAVLQMNVGSRVRLEVPPALFDPAKVRSPDLPAGSTSVWEFELVDMKPAPPVPPFELSAPGKATKTASGLEIETLVEGTGKSPRKRDMVTVNYAGWLKKNGLLFDSSYRRGEPAVFGVDQVIPGWTEALLTMKEGGKARLTIPAALAYGAMGSPPKIGPNEDLVFLVELIKVGR